MAVAPTCQLPDASGEARGPVHGARLASVALVGALAALTVAATAHARGASTARAIALAAAAGFGAGAHCLRARRGGALAAHGVFGLLVALAATASFVDAPSRSAAPAAFALVPVAVAAVADARALHAWTALATAAVVAVFAVEGSRGGEAAARGLTALAAAYAAVCVAASLLAGSLRRELEHHRESAACARACAEEVARTLEDTNAALAAALASRDAFLANVSHEIRTPMHAILASAEALAAGPLEGAQREDVEVIRAAGDGLLVIVNDLLDLSKIEAGRVELERVPFAPRRVVAHAAAMVEREARRRGVALTVDVDPEVPRALVGDPHRLGQVLLNLLSNAVKFTHVGAVSVRVEGRAEKGLAPLRVTVRDTGVGIAPDALARIFEPFAQADASTTRRYGGTGLGLAITRRLVDLMGGALEVESAPGAGSTFRFTARLTACDDPPEATQGRDGDATTRGGRRVLLAEDNAVNQRIALRMLAKLGCDVRVAEHGAAALRAFEAEAFDLVLMDCHMPELDGLDATRAIRRLERARGLAPTPVVAVTADALPSDRTRCLDAGMDDHLTKPFRFDALADVLTRWCR